MGLVRQIFNCMRDPDLTKSDLKEESAVLSIALISFGAITAVGALSFSKIHVLTHIPSWATTTLFSVGTFGGVISLLLLVNTCVKWEELPPPTPSTPI